MAMRRIAQRVLLQTARLTPAQRCTALLSILPPRPHHQPALVQVPPLRLEQTRWYSSADAKPKVYDYKAVKSIVDAPTQDCMLIDVREPSEYDAGFIPTALNIPITSQPDALFLSPEDFAARFHFPKPPPGKEIVFYCKSGVRSSAAAQMALQAGYRRVGEYPGSWRDWEKRGGLGEGGSKVGSAV